MHPKSLLVLLQLVALGAGCADMPGSTDSTSDDIALAETQQALSLPRPDYGDVAWEQLALPGNTANDLRANLPALAGTGVSLTLHWPAANINDATRLDIVR